MNEEHHPASWWGITMNDSVDEAGDSPQDRNTGRVLVLMSHDANRRHVMRSLTSLGDVFAPGANTLTHDSFDLVVTDLAGLGQWRSLLLEAKYRAEPTFLPVLLILSRAELKRSIRSYWNVIDGFVTSPVEPRELLERVALMLRTRQLALAQQSHLAYVVNHDRVSGLPNKHQFMARVVDAVRDASVLGLQLHISVLHLSLVRVLTSLGHQGLDTVASAVSSRLSALTDGEITLARLTTEDWGFVHKPGSTLQEVLDLLKEIGAVAERPIAVNGDTIHLTPRIGVGIYPLDGDNAGAVVDRALAALETANSSTPVFYAREVQLAALRSIRVEALLFKALENQQLELWYQPQVEMATGKVLAVEALMRWRLESGELVQPDQFLPVARDTGIIRDIGVWAIRTACRTLGTWRTDGVPIRRVSVNLTAQDLESDNFLDTVHEALRTNRLPPECLELELTESDLIELSSNNIDKLARLRDEGVRIAIDDFGTGYSSLSYLRNLPVTTLKIDRAFVKALTMDVKDAVITEGIAWLGKRLGLEVISEGVEEPEQATALTGLGITMAQGYLYARPMPESELRDWLEQRAQGSGRNG